MIKQAVISDAGASSRFLPIVKTIPKSMLPIGNKPIIQIVIEECVEAGVEEIILVAREDTKAIFDDYLNNKCSDLENFLNDMGKPERFNPVREVLNLPKVKIITQDASLPYGTAAPVMSARPYLKEGEPFLYLHADDIVLAEKRDCKVLVEEYEKDSSYSSYMIAEETTIDRVHLYGMIKTKEGKSDELQHIIEKPKPEETPSLLASYGRFLYKYNIFEYMTVERIGKDNEMWNVDALTAMAQDFPVKVIPNQGKWVTTGDPKNYLQAQILYNEFMQK